MWILPADLDLDLLSLEPLRDLLALVASSSISKLAGESDLLLLSLLSTFGVTLRDVLWEALLNLDLEPLRDLLRDFNEPLLERASARDSLRVRLFARELLRDLDFAGDPLRDLDLAGDPLRDLDFAGLLLLERAGEPDFEREDVCDPLLDLDLEGECDMLRDRERDFDLDFFLECVEPS